MKTIKLIVLLAVIGAAALAVHTIYLSKTAVSEEDYIEIVARVSAMRIAHEKKFSDVSAEPETEEELISEKAAFILADMGISVDSLKKFDKKHPGFLEKPENQRRLFMKLNEFIEEEDISETSG